jgi:hypothetical protein
VLESEARRIALVLAPYGVLDEPRLAALARAAHWEPGSFARACDVAVELGLIHRLGLGYYGLTHGSGPGSARGERIRAARIAPHDEPGGSARRAR